MKRKGFTLIELLAVIIILGILMLIAIPSVTTYINNSRKNTYVSTINEIIKGAIVKVNSGELDMYDTDTTYYIPTSAIKLESGNAKSPYGDLNDAYVVVTYDGESYDYYFVGKDETGMGVDGITKSENITKDSIKEVESVDKTVALTGKSKVIVFDDTLTPGTAQTAGSNVSGQGSSAPSGTSGNSNNNEEENNNNNTSVTGLQRPYTGMAYAANMEADGAAGKAVLNELLPAQIEIYATGEEARLRLQQQQPDHKYLPYCLKYKLNNDVVEEIYIEFVVTNSFVSSHPGSVAGTYTIQGDVDEISLDSRPVYESNRQQILAAFGGATNTCGTVYNRYGNTASGAATVGTRCFNIAGDSHYEIYVDADGYAFVHEDAGNDCRINGPSVWAACY